MPLLVISPAGRFKAGVFHIAGKQVSSRRLVRTITPTLLAVDIVNQSEKTKSKMQAY
jgi:hypothetical protein